MPKRMFVYEMPYSVRKQLCRVLDASDQWEELGGTYMHFDCTELQCMRRKDSPTDVLLTDWGNQNHTVDELFVLLSRMQNYRAMSLLKKHVQEKYHNLLHEGEEFMTQSYPKSNSNIKSNSGLRKLETYTPSAPPMKNPSQEYKDIAVQQNLNQAADKFNNQNKEINGEKKIQNVSTAVITDNININHTSTSERRQSIGNVDGSIPEIPFEELEIATNKWDPRCILGKGGFGTVFKGVWKHTVIAIKKLEPQRDPNSTSEIKSDTLAQSVNELRALNNHRHDNILSIYGYSIRRNVCCLVYQFMANGSLYDRLHPKHNTSPLNWWQRLNIMTGTARAIQFIHSLSKNQNAPLVHGDIKSANILLDNNFEPRLGDFGLAREGPQQLLTHIQVSKVHGTRPYLPDEFLKSKRFSVKVDTYSFGVVLFEVATGLRAFDKSRKERYLRDYILNYPEDKRSELIDRNAGVDVCSSGHGLIVVGCNCVADLARNRPNMVDVFQDVEVLLKTYQSAVRSRALAQRGFLSPTSPIDLQNMYDFLSTQSPSVANGPLPLLSPDPRVFATPRQSCSPELTIPFLKPFTGLGIHQASNPARSPLFVGSPVFPPPPPPHVSVVPPTQCPPSSVDVQKEYDDQSAGSYNPVIPDLTLLHKFITVKNRHSSNLPAEMSEQNSMSEEKKHSTSPISASSTSDNDLSNGGKIDKSSEFKISLPSDVDTNIPLLSILQPKHEAVVEKPSMSEMKNPSCQFTPVPSTSITHTDTKKKTGSKSGPSELTLSGSESNNSGLPVLSELMPGKPSM